ncbi:TIGR04282 family arsenosugar biosynthesis glycosyltransferase, partial [Oleiphilus sp. HI0123]
KFLLVQFAKRPLLGHVKTRIAKVLGEEAALSIHMELVADIALRFSQCIACDYQLWFDQKSASFDSLEAESINAHKKLKALIAEEGLDCHEQRGENLGERMCDTLERSLVDYQSVAIIGSDCPNVTVSDLKVVKDSLSEHDVAIIPAEDGGYVLLALRREALARVNGNWLDGVEWGSDKALEQTLSCCSRIGLSYQVLPDSWDVDEVADYERWKEVI